jgi:hypothetical protein
VDRLVLARLERHRRLAATAERELAAQRRTHLVVGFRLGHFGAHCGKLLP